MILLQLQHHTSVRWLFEKFEIKQETDSQKDPNLSTKRKNNFFICDIMFSINNYHSPKLLHVTFWGRLIHCPQSHIQKIMKKPKTTLWFIFHTTVNEIKTFQNAKTKRPANKFQNGPFLVDYTGLLNYLMTSEKASLGQDN